MIEKHNQINSSSSYRFAPVVISYLEVTILGERHDTIFFSFLYCVLFIDFIAFSENYAFKIPCFVSFVGIFSGSTVFLMSFLFQYVLKFFRSKLS